MTASAGDHRTELLQMIIVIAAATIIDIIVTYCPLFWRSFGFALEWMQFPSRILDAAVAGAILVYILAGNMLLQHEHRMIRRAIYIITLALLIVSGIQCRTEVAAEEPPTHLAGGLITDQIPGLGAGEEWLPDDADRIGLHEPNKSYDPDGSGADGFKHDHGKYYEVYVLMDKAYYDVPYLYYKGYEAYLLDDTGAPIERLDVGKSDRLAYVRVYMPQGREGIGHIMVTYRKTTIQKAAYVMNTIAIIGLMVAAGISMVRDNRLRMKQM